MKIAAALIFLFGVATQTNVADFKLSLPTIPVNYSGVLRDSRLSRRPPNQTAWSLAFAALTNPAV
jgi:hypothetical protein